MQAIMFASAGIFGADTKLANGQTISPKSLAIVAGGKTGSP